MIPTKGIDVSEHNGAIDWTAVKKEGCKFAMIRAGYGKNMNQVDKFMAKNVAGCEAVGLDYGFYHYSYALDAAGAKKEAEFCLSLIRQHRPVYPIAFDIEDKTQHPLSNQQLTDIALAFLETVKAAGYYVCLYSSLSWLAGKFDARADVYDKWVAQWASKPTYKQPFGIWQYSSTGKVAGINGDVDLNLAYKNYPEIIAAGGLNGFPKPQPSPQTPKTLDNTPSPWAEEAVEWAKKAGILLGGTDGDLRLHDAVTREEMCVILKRFSDTAPLVN